MMNKYVIGLGLIAALVAAFYYQQYRYSELDGLYQDVVTTNNNLTLKLSNTIKANEQLLRDKEIVEDLLLRERKKAADIDADFTQASKDIEELGDKDDEVNTILNTRLPDVLYDRLLLD